MAGRALLARLASAGGPLIGLGALGGLAYVGQDCVFTVESGHRAIMYNRIGGINDHKYDEGFHLRMPWFQRPIVYETRTRQKEFRGQRTGTKDLQTVAINLRVLYRADKENLPKLYREVGPSDDSYGELPGFDSNVLPSIVQETLKSIVAVYNADLLVTKREDVSQQIRDDLSARASDFGIVIDDVAITDFSFSQQYSEAVERKQIAQQESQRAALLVEKAQQEKRQKIVEAEGESESAELIGKSVRENPAYLNLQKIKAAVSIAQTVSQSTNRVYLNANSLLLDVNQHTIDEGSLVNSAAGATNEAGGSLW